MARSRGGAAAPQPPGEAARSSNNNLVELKKRYPGRELQINELATVLRSIPAAVDSVYVYGPPSAGKTSVLRDLLPHLNIPHAYINCREMTRTRSVLESILHQLKGPKRPRDDTGSAPAPRCDSISEFLAALPSAVSRVKSAAWIVLDNAQRMAGNDLLTGLTLLSSTTGANVGIILVAPVPWSRGIFMHESGRMSPPHPIYFPAYTPTQMIKILAARPPPSNSPTNPDLNLDLDLSQAYGQFLKSVVPLITRATNNLLDMWTAVESLWPQYSAPLLEGREIQSAVLMGRIRGDLQRVIGDLDMKCSTIGTTLTQGAEVPAASGGATRAATAPLPAAQIPATAGAGASDRKVSSQGLSFELPYMSKFLLIAAYVASRNKHTTDRSVFDPGYSKRGKRSSMAHDRLTEAAAEAVLRGPHSFPLERLLHIFYCMYGHHGMGDDDYEEESEEREESRKRMAREVQSAEVLMQLSTLVSQRLLSVSGNILDGASYRCNLTDDLAQAISANLRLSLRDYLKLA